MDDAVRKLAWKCLQEKHGNRVRNKGRILEMSDKFSLMSDRKIISLA